MVSNGQNHYILYLFLIVTLWTSIGMPRELQEASLQDEHEEWMVEHGKAYKDSAEKEKRFQIFKEKLEFIESFNAAEERPYKLGINQFADLTKEEFRASLNQVKRSPPELRKRRKTPFRHASVTDIPACVDWRKRGAITPIKNQYHGNKRCGSCWAFSAVAAIEGIHQITAGQLVSLSEQELVDCDTKDENAGCRGGFEEDAFEYIVKNGGGITSEAKYPYKAKKGTCKTMKKALNVALIKDYENVPVKSEEALLKAVADQPVSVSVDGRGFLFYKSGILTGDCGTELNHSVTVVGYGTADDGTKYWIIKNSWGTRFGEKGYTRIKRDVDVKEGLCGIAMEASYPVA